MKFKVDIAEVTYSNDTVMTLMISEVERSPERTEDRAEESEKFRDLVRLLVEHEALDPNMAKMGAKKNKRNKTPLHYVVEFCSKKDVEALGMYFMINFDVKTYSNMIFTVKLGAHPEPDEDGKWPFHIAAACGQPGTLKYLLHKYSDYNEFFDIDVKDHQDNTPLHEAVKRCQIEKSAVSMVEMLVEKGEDELVNSEYLKCIFEIGI